MNNKNCLSRKLETQSGEAVFYFTTIISYSKSDFRFSLFFRFRLTLLSRSRLCGSVALKTDALPFAALVASEHQRRAEQLVSSHCDPCTVQTDLDTVDQDDRHDRTHQQNGDKGDNSRSLGITGTAQTAGDDKLGGLERLQNGDDQQDLCADPDDFGVLVVQRDQVSAEENKYDRQNNRSDHTNSPGA